MIQEANSVLHREFQDILKCTLCKTNKTQRGSRWESSKVREDALSLKPLCHPSNTQIQTPHMGNQIWKCLIFLYLICNHCLFLLLFMLRGLCFLPYTRLIDFYFLNLCSWVPDSSWDVSESYFYSLIWPGIVWHILWWCTYEVSPTASCFKIFVPNFWHNFRRLYLVDNSLGNVYLKNYFLSCYLSFGPLWYK